MDVQATSMRHVDAYKTCMSAKLEPVQGEGEEITFTAFALADVLLLKNLDFWP